MLLHADQEPQHPDEWEQWLTELRKAIRRTAVTTPSGAPDENARCLMHASCARRGNARTRSDPRASDACEPLGLACDGQVRDGAWVAEITGMLDLQDWPEGMRVIVRKERPHPGAQLRFTDIDGNRLTAFATSTPAGKVKLVALASTA